MIQSMEIKGFRGIREGSLADLTPLVVLVGPNGSGKSTVIEAMLVGASSLPGDALVQVIRRHEAGGSDPRWILWRGGESGPTEISVTAGMKRRNCYLELGRGLPSDQTVINYLLTDAPGGSYGQASIQARKRRYHGHSSLALPPLDGLREVHLVEGYVTAFQRPLFDLYTRTVQNGRKIEAMEILAKVVPGVANMEILTEGDAPILYLVYADTAVPASLSGDGVQSLVRLTLELAASGDGLALLEEPEVHQHPAAMRQSGRVILAAVRRGLQVVLTTHSLELIDALLAESTPQDLERLSLYSLVLQGGVLKFSRLPGPEVQFSRSQIEEDLR